MSKTFDVELAVFYIPSFKQNYLFSRPIVMLMPVSYNVLEVIRFVGK